MRRFARVHCGSVVHEKEIDSRGRMILAYIGNIPSIQHKLVTKCKVNDDSIRKYFRYITLDPVTSVEFIERE
jgi:hypothetical protein